MALIPPNYFDSVVSLGHMPGGVYQSAATGFLVGFNSGQKNIEGRALYRTFLVTNRHVFEDVREIFMRFNLTAGNSKTYRVVLEDDAGKKWNSHPNPKVDIAVLPVSFGVLQETEKVRCYFIEEEDIAFRDVIKAQGISPGDSIYVLGFPLGIAGEGQNYVVVKGGVLSRVDDEIIDRESAFIVDANIFPGNSGGPVILRPEMASISGTKAVSKAFLLGVVSAYIPYQDTAVSQQTNQVRVIFNENSGLATVVPMDFVREVVSDFLKRAQKVATPTEVDVPVEERPIK